MRNYTVMIESEDGVERELIDFDTVKEARDFCDRYDWLYPDENNFHWEMYIRDNRYERMFA